VADIRATAGLLADALAAEPLPAPAAHPVTYHTVRPARIFRIPYFVVAGLAAAACLAVIFTLSDWPSREPVAKKQVVALAEPEAVREASVPVAAAPAAPGSPIELQFAKEEAGQPSPAPAGARVDQLRSLAAVVPNPPPEAAKASRPPAAPANIGRLTLGANALTADARFGSPAGAAWDAPGSALAGPRIAGGAVFNGQAKSADTYGRTAYVTGSLEYGRGPSAGAAFNRPWGGPAAAGRPFNTEAYDYLPEGDFRTASDHPLSTFSVDVDTASYSNVRRFLTSGRLPPRDAVRIEELVNYFAYDYAAPPVSGPAPFAASLEVAAAPWTPAHRLVRIGLKAREVPVAARPAANLVFLIDVSGSMAAPNKLPLVQEAMRMLIEQLKPEDRVAIVTYAGTSGLALPSTPAGHRQELLDTLDTLRAGGQTNGAMGIQLAYDVAKANFIPGGINRVILATDGDFNVGVTDRGDLVRLIEEKAKTGVFLTALGVGMGNYKDATLEQLAAHGHGTYAYLDSPREARKVLVEQVNGTLATVAKDVKVQVEFNPAKVQAYRLIGYEDRRLQAEDFNNDRIDAGDVGAGHTVTALYEVIPVGVPWTPASTVEALKYRQPETRGRPPAAGGELLTVKVRYQAPDGGASKRLEFPLVDRGEAFADASADFKFAAAVAGFGMVLRDSPYKGAETLADVARWAAEGTGSDAGGYRNEFLSLVKRTEQLLPSQG
jgi:Ca-activated chloride channel homolog